MKRIHTLAALSLAAALIPGIALAQPGGAKPIDQATTSTVMLPTLSATGAQKMIDGVEKLARERHQGVTVVIVDAGGNLLMVKRLDGADLGSLQAAMAKAVSALKLKSPTGNFANMASGNPGLVAGFTSAGFTILGGGQPIRINGEVVGAIACSGGAGGEDDMYNNAGLAAVGATLVQIPAGAPGGAPRQGN